MVDSKHQRPQTVAVSWTASSTGWITEQIKVKSIRRGGLSSSSTDFTAAVL